MHGGMKASMKRVFWILAVLFFMVLGTMFKLVAYERQTIASNSYNTRLGYGNEDFKRGYIYDANGNVMAESVNYGEGYEREYPYGKIAAHITGYTGAGAAGIEAVENFTLLGVDNEVSLRVKNLFSGKELSGDNVHLTIDMDIQKLAYELLGNNKGAAVVMNPTTGGIIAMASTPSFDPNTVRADWGELSTSEDSPMLNRATQGLYPPGSTFKIVTALTSMRNLENIDDYIFECTGEIETGDKIIHCFNSKVHGIMTIDDAMAYSCNSTFVELGSKVGAMKLRETADSIHFNSDITFDLPISDCIVSLTKSTSESELAQTSIGQGKTLATPLYMAMLVSSVANDGLMMQPYMVHKISDADGNIKKTNVPIVYDTVMTADEANRLTEMLEKVVNIGTGTAAQLEGYQAAGKTGTAENAKEYDHSWFVGFASTDKPQVAVAVILENVSGAARATPIGGKLMQAVLDKANGVEIEEGDYVYTPSDENSGDDINTNIIEDVVLPEDDFIIGGEELNSDSEENGGGLLTVPNEYYDEYGHKIYIVNK